MSHKLQDGAIFIADAHYPNHSKELVEFLNKIKSGNIATKQLILMGDIFDLLVGGSNYLSNKFRSEINLLEDIAKDIEVIYLEGNHDFNLKALFKNINIIPIEKQPLVLTNASKTIALSHGDKYNTTLGYKIYTKLIRSPLIISLIPESYPKTKLESMSSKKICTNIKNFKEIINKILQNYNSDLIIEGHFHQGRVIDRYISLPSFACNKEYGVFREKEFKVDFLKL